MPRSTDEMTAKHAVLLCISAVLGGCASVSIEPVPALTDTKVFQVRGSTISVGETMIESLTGHWLQVYEPSNAVQIVGELINPPREWINLYRETTTGYRLLTSPLFYNNGVAIRVDAALQPPAAAPVLQIKSGRKGRTWELARPTAFSATGYQADLRYTDQSGWRLVYIGTLDRRVRMTADNLGAGGEKIGTIEYIHDLNQGPEFVFRGARVAIRQTFPDGRMEFAVTKD